MEKINSIVVDDEISNTTLLVQYLKKYCPLIDVVGVANTKADAIALINELKPKLIFLDIILDEGNGFEVLDEISHNKYKVIFITSHIEYAIKAFKFSAIDYILKPLKVKDLVVGVNSAIKDIEKYFYTSNEQIETLNNSINDKTKLNFIAVPSVDKIEFVKLEDLVYLQSDGRYTIFFLKDGSKMVASRNLGEYESIIDKTKFFRIHNSYIVNLRYVVSINKRDGSYCEMITRVSLPIAKRRQDSLNRFLKIK